METGRGSGLLWNATKMCLDRRGVRSSKAGSVAPSALVMWASKYRLARRLVGLLSALLLTATTTAGAEIQFEEVTRAAGIRYSGPGAGASWGDLNGDGWPDLWVTSHHGDPPVIYLNRADGTFSDVTSSALPVWEPADLHGAAWADFDNDGDQDLIGLSGGGAGQGSSPNQLFVNRGGVLTDEAEQRGLAYPMGRGRTPLWLDADGDGRLDVLLSNYRRPGGRAPTAILRQTGTTFREDNEELEFLAGRKTRLEQWIDLGSNAAGGRFAWPGRVSGGDFAQLADLSGDGSLDLIVYSPWMRLYSITSVPFKETTTLFGWPTINQVRDAAAEDFDGDGQVDLYLPRARLSASTAIQTGPSELIGILLKGPAAAQPRGVQFRTEGEVRFEIHPPWQDPTDPRGPPAVFVGSQRRPAGEHVFTVASADAAGAAATAVPEAPDGPRLTIDYDASSGEWTLRSTLPRVTFIVRSMQPVRELRTLSFESSAGAEEDFLLLRRGDEFMSQPLQGSAAIPDACHSVAAGDFDNDMDVDLYVVCSGLLRNRPNRLLENDGKGSFRAVEQAGGAAGSEVGRGDVVAAADYDRDGFLDLFVENGLGPPPFADGPHQLFRNLGNGNHWLEIDLEGVGSNRDGIGARVVLETGGVTQVRGQGGGMHSFAQNHARLHFGLGTAERVDRLTVHWPGGAVQTVEAIDVDQVLLLREPPPADTSSR